MVYLIKYLAHGRECFDSEQANNSHIALTNFKKRKPYARFIKYKSRQGVWLNVNY